MPVSAKSLGIDRLDLTDRLALVEEIWASICADPTALMPSNAQRDELERRIADDDAFPDDVVPWSEVKAAADAQFRR